MLASPNDKTLAVSLFQDVNLPRVHARGGDVYHAQLVPLGLHPDVVAPLLCS